MDVNRAMLRVLAAVLVAAAVLAVVKWIGGMHLHL